MASPVDSVDSVSLPSNVSGTSSFNKLFPTLIVTTVVFFFQKLMLQMNTKNKAEEVEEQTVELDVSDEEMARR